MTLSTNDCSTHLNSLIVFWRCLIAKGPAQPLYGTGYDSGATWSSGYPAISNGTTAYPATVQTPPEAEESQYTAVYDSVYDGTGVYEAAAGLELAATSEVSPWETFTDESTGLAYYYNRCERS